MVAVQAAISEPDAATMSEAKGLLTGVLRDLRGYVHPPFLCCFLQLLCASSDVELSCAHVERWGHHWGGGVAWLAGYASGLLGWWHDWGSLTDGRVHIGMTRVV